MKARHCSLIGLPLLFLFLSSAPRAALAEPLRIELPAETRIPSQAKEFSIALRAIAPPENGARPSLVVELSVPERACSKQLREVQVGKEPYRLLDGIPGLRVEGGPAGRWTVWKGKSDRKERIRLHVRNDVDPQGQALTSPGEYGSLGNGGGLTVILPLAEQEVLLGSSPLTTFDVTVRYGDSEEGLESNKTERTTFTLERPAGGVSSQTPAVSFKVARIGGSPSTGIQMGDEVELQYKVERAVSGKILGPMDGGQSMLILGPPDKNGTLSGSLKTRALGRANYTLEAEVKPEGSKATVQVSRSVSVDVRSLGEYANLALVPATVLPGGPVDVHWGAWGLDAKDDLKLVWSDHQGYRQVQSLDVKSAKGDFCFIPPNTRETNEISVRIGVRTDAEERRLEVRRWQTVGGADWLGNDSKATASARTWLKDVDGTLTGLAVNKDALVLSTTEGLWRMDLNPQRVEPFAPLEKLPLSRGAIKWLGVIAFNEDQFAGLCRCGVDNVGRLTADDTVSLVRFRAQGGEVKSANLPPQFGGYDDHELLALSGRIYVVGVNNDKIGGTVRRVIRETVSMDLDAVETGKERGVAEPLLSNQLLRGDWSMVTVNNAIYALSRNDDPKYPAERGALRVFSPSGRTSRYSGTLLFPRIAGLRELAREGAQSRKGGLPLDKAGTSLVEKGVPLNVGGVLVLFGARDGERLSPSPRETSGANCPVTGMPQDLAYNPQTNVWWSCGNGLNIDRKMLMAYLGGAHSRLWAIRPDTMEAFTLAVDSPQLFVADYQEGNPLASLPPLYDEEKTFTLQNDLEDDLSLDWRAAPLADISLAGAKSSDPQLVPARGSATLKIRYPQAGGFRLSLYVGRGRAAQATTGLVTLDSGAAGWSVNVMSDSKQQFNVVTDGSNRVSIKPR